MVLLYTQAVEYMLDIPKFNQKTTLDNTRRLLELLGSPELGKKIIHVAGTNGKGSVCAYLSNILVKANKKVGLFTSPHLVYLNERMRIQNNPIDNDTFLLAFHKVKDAVEILMKEGYKHPAFFEFVFAMAMVVFHEVDVEYIVLEVGLGGRLDATNVIERPLVSVITSIGYDHMELLGDTLDKIAREKAGIIKSNVPLVYYDTCKDVVEVIESIAKEKGTKSYKISKNSYKILKKTDIDIDFSPTNGYYEYDALTVPFIAEYQVDNAMLAIKVIELIEDPIEYSTLKEGIKTTRHSGRMEEVINGVFVDGAHNLSGIQEFIRTVNSFDRKGKKILLFSAVKDKDYVSMIRMICEQLNFEEVIVTQLDNKRAINVEILRECFMKYSDKPVMMYHTVEEALLKGIESKADNDTLFCVGSLYLVGSLIQGIRRFQND